VFGVNIIQVFVQNKKHFILKKRHALQKIVKMLDGILGKQNDCLNGLMETFLKKICTKKNI
jgi:hypothetical protein